MHLCLSDTRHPVHRDATDSDQTDGVGDGTSVPIAHSHCNQRAAVANPTTDHPNGVEVKLPIGPHARDAFRLARQAQTTGTAPASASAEVECVRRAACNPQLWGPWAFRNGPRGSLLGVPLDGSYRSAVSGTGWTTDGGQGPDNGPVWLPSPRFRAGEARARRPTAPCRHALGMARRFLKGRWARIRVRVTCSPPEAWPKRPGVGLHPPWGASSISAGAVLWSVAARQGFAFGEAVSFDEDADRRPDDAIRCQRSLEVDCPVLGVGHDD